MVNIVDVRDVVVPIRSDISNAFIDFSSMTVSLVAVVTDVSLLRSLKCEAHRTAPIRCARRRPNGPARIAGHVRAEAVSSTSLWAGRRRPNRARNVDLARARGPSAPSPRRFFTRSRKAALAASGLYWLRHGASLQPTPAPRH